MLYVLDYCTQQEFRESKPSPVLNINIFCCCTKVTLTNSNNNSNSISDNNNTSNSASLTLGRLGHAPSLPQGCPATGLGAPVCITPFTFTLKERRKTLTMIQYGAPLTRAIGAILLTACRSLLKEGRGKSY